MLIGCAGLALLAPVAAMAQEPLTIDKDGNVAIGTDSPWPTNDVTSRLNPGEEELYDGRTVE